MKELTTEQKAQRYDSNYEVYTELTNRLEDVKGAIKKQNYGIAMDILYKPYPEFQITTSIKLEESEDERIRKYIISSLNSLLYTKGSQDDKERNDAIAWLEKQGKPTYNKELSELLHEVICRFINDSDIPYSDREKVSMKLLPYVELLEKQGEQNIVWSEEDEACAYLILRELEQDKKDSPDYSKHFTRLIDWFTTRFKLLRPQGRWKPSEIQLETLKELSHDFPTKRGTIEEILKHIKQL